MLGLSAPNPDTKDFSGKVLWNLKSFAKINCVVGMKVLRIFKGLFQKPLKARFGTAVPTYYEKIKNAEKSAFFRKRYKLGLSAPNPDTRNFSGKVSWNFKSFAKMK